jgi:hypothetical protein
MAAPLLTKEQLYAIYKAAVQGADPANDKLTDWSAGSINDMLAGASACVGTELQFYIANGFSKTLIANTEAEEMDELVVDHYGEEFARTGDVPAVGIVKVTRTVTTAAETLDAGTVVQTDTPTGGSPITFTTDIDLDFVIGQAVGYVAITAENAGTAGNIEDGDITTISPAITGWSVTNEEPTAGGAQRLTDSEYQDFVGDKISEARGATDSGIEAKLRGVPGIVNATVHTRFQAVKNWNIASGAVEGAAYTVVRSICYIADANGTANPALVAKAEEALAGEKAAGANIDIIAASAQSMDWTASYTLNGAGPNFGSLSVDSSPIKQTMRDYIDNLGIGDDFSRSSANAYVLSVWGPSGSNDISAFTTSVPSGDVSTGENVKLVAGVMGFV